MIIKIITTGAFDSKFIIITVIVIIYLNMILVICKALGDFVLSV